MERGHRRSAKSTMTLRRVAMLALVWALVASSVSFAAGSPRTPLGTPAHPGRHPRLVSITLSPDSATLMPGETLRLAATGHYSDGSIKDVTWWARWRSSDTSVVALAQWHRGLATAIAEGTATISATVRRVTGSALVTVGGPTATLESIEIAPEGSTIAEGGTLQYAARGQYSDATSRDITATVSWSSSDVVTATIDAAGLATGLRSGTTTIAAAMDGVSDSVALTVSPRIDSIEITPHDPSISVGDDVQFGVLAHFADGSSSDVSPNVVWSSSDVSVATIDAAGLATGLAEGTTTITASCDVAGLCSSLQDSTVLQVSPPEPPPPTEGSSQDLIEQDLADGIIDYGASLIYRAWALFWDARLPARYDGSGSTGEDQILFDEIEAALPDLPTDQQSELQGYLARPTSPLSPFGPAQTLSVPRTLGENVVPADPAPTGCTAPNKWLHADWPEDASAKGFRAWICAPKTDPGSPADAPDPGSPADDAVNLVLATGAALWSSMTMAEPNGMGLPRPDTGAPDNDGNGKIDLYIVDTKQCRARGTDPCKPIPGKALAMARATAPCGLKDGFPSQSCSGFILLSRNRLDNDEFGADFAHEFFHVLQNAHNALAKSRDTGLTNSKGKVLWDKAWYTEASATWAAWHFARNAAKPGIWQWIRKSQPDGSFTGFQYNNRSLLEYSETTDHQYESWLWPLFQEIELGAENVFRTWALAEGASDPEGIDAAVGLQMPFETALRDFAVRNLQPSRYVPAPGPSTGLEDDSWQTDPALSDFPVTQHILNTQTGALAQGGAQDVTTDHDATVLPLAAQYDEFEILDPSVRQVTIDVGPLQNSETADLDVVGRLAPSQGSTDDVWRRVRSSTSTLTLCRDTANENFNLIYVVISNHSRARAPFVGSGPDPAYSLKGSYRIRTKDHCDVPIAYEGSFSGTQDSYTSQRWEGTARFELAATVESCATGEPPTSDGVEYCYRFVGGELTWSADPWTDQFGLCRFTPTSSVHVDLAPDTVPMLRIVGRTLDPRLVDWYYMLEANQDGFEMDVPDGTPLTDPTMSCGGPTLNLFTWLYTPRDNYRTGWELSGSQTLDHQSFSWDLHPIFEST